MSVSGECLCCQRSLRRTDHSSRGVLPAVVCVWVWSSENKRPRHLLWTGRRGKDYDDDDDDDIGVHPLINSAVLINHKVTWASHYAVNIRIQLFGNTRSQSDWLGPEIYCMYKSMYEDKTYIWLPITMSLNTCSLIKIQIISNFDKAVK
jgi:hypothetical protein